MSTRIFVIMIGAGIVAMGLYLFIVATKQFQYVGGTFILVLGFVTMIWAALMPEPDDKIQ